jgi:lambda family phage minor tail protein L
MSVIRVTESGDTRVTNAGDTRIAVVPAFLLDPQRHPYTGQTEAENQRLAPDALVYLFALDTKPIGGNDIFCWTPGQLTGPLLPQRIPNPCCAGNTNYYFLTGNLVPTISRAVDINTNFALRDFGSGYAAATGTLSGTQFARVYPTPGSGPSTAPYLFSITAGRTYEFHILARPIGCQVRVMLGFWDASLNFISQTAGGTAEITSTANPDARELSAYTQIWVRATAPANAAYAGCMIDLMRGSQTSVTNPKAIWTRAYFGETKPEALGPTPYVPPSSFGRLTFQGQVYEPIPVQMTGIAWSGRGPAPRPRAAVANIGGVLSSLLATYGDLVGAKVTRITTYRKFLDDQPTADPTSYWEPDVWRIERKMVQTPQLVEWELASILDQEGRRLPGRHMLRDACSWIYRRWTGTGFDYSTATCPYTGTGYFTVTGELTANPADDKCGKHLSDCRKRFPVPETLPSSAFPGLNKYV